MLADTKMTSYVKGRYSGDNLLCYYTTNHAIEICREYFEKYLASSGLKLHIDLKEQDRTRKRDMDRAKTLIRLQNKIEAAEGDDVQGCIINIRKG